MSKITAIVCAYNEERTIEGVLNGLLNCQNLDEIIAVNDGSTDNTGIILKNFLTKNSSKKIKIIEFKENKGKGFAMAEAIKNSENEVLLFIDADLINLREEHISQLINPLFEKKAKMVIGKIIENNSIFKNKIDILKPLSGQRALFKEDILPLIEKMKETHFGVETLINLYYRISKMKVIYVDLENLGHLIKFQKFSPQKATKEYILAGKDIFKTTIKDFPSYYLKSHHINTGFEKFKNYFIKKS
jgi:glycosyltransferase involved in cell wall biosynthesis